jgi:hypothetical protein
MVIPILNTFHYSHWDSLETTFRVFPPFPAWWFWGKPQILVMLSPQTSKQARVSLALFYCTLQNGMDAEEIRDMYGTYLQSSKLEARS